MKNPAAIFFICLHLFANTEFAQVYKIPAVFRHYQSHCAETPGLSFLSFLQLHYGKKAICDQSDSKKHGQLPFKKVKSVQPIQLLTCSNVSVKIERIETYPQKDFSLFDFPWPATEFTDKQLRPPIGDPCLFQA